MSNEFKIQIKSDIKLNIEPIKLNKLYLKLKAKNNKGEIYNANISISLNYKSNKLIVEDINISKLELDNSSEDELSYNKYRNIYKDCFKSLSSSDSSSSSSSEEDLKNMYKQLNKFAKNIKFNYENNKVNSIYFTLKDTNINKMKLRGKLN